MPKFSFLIRGAICLLFIFLPLHSLDQWFYDQFFRLRGASHRATPFILVRVNDAKLYPLFRDSQLAYPREELQFSPKTHALWHRGFYDTLVRKLQAHDPEVIAFTPYFAWLDRVEPPAFPQGNVLFASALNEQNQLIPPKPALTRADNYGFSNLFPDRDNVVRQAYLVYSSGASLGLRIYHRLTDKPIKRNLIDPLRIDFRGPAGSYPSVDAVDVVDGKVDPGAFRGKVVLIGKEGSPYSDFETPLGKMSALEIQANIADTFFHGREIHLVPRFVTWSLAAVAVVASITIIVAFPLTLAWLFLLLFSLLIVLVSLFTFSQFKVWLGVANPIFCVFATHLLMLGYKLSRQEEQQWKMQQEAEYLREMDQFKNNFISLFSHDLKTPIAKIKAITNRLVSAPSPTTEEAKEGFRAIDRTSNELARLISDILRVTKMESMSLEPRREVVDLNRLVELAASRLAFLAEEKRVKVVLDLEPLFSMEGDPDLLGEVIHNLLENAIKYSHADGEVVVRTEEEEEERVRVAVSDQGVGIPPDELPRVTGKFYRGRATSTTTKGSGLGLYLAKYFVELHRGTLDIRSEYGKGTTVSFSLPLTA